MTVPSVMRKLSLQVGIHLSCVSQDWTVWKCRVLRKRELEGWASGEQEAGRQMHKDRVARAWAALGTEGVQGLPDVRATMSPSDTSCCSCLNIGAVFPMLHHKSRPLHKQRPPPEGTFPLLTSEQHPFPFRTLFL